MKSVERQLLRWRVLLLAPMCLVFGVFAASGQDEGVEKEGMGKDGLIKHEVSIDGIDFTLTYKVVYRIGEAMDIKLIVANRSKEDIEYVVNNNLASLDEISITDQGMKIPWTRCGEYTLSPSREKFRNFVSTIKPGKSVGFFMNLARYFDLSMVGTYEAKIVWKQNKGLIGSNTSIKRLVATIQFEVKE